MFLKNDRMSRQLRSMRRRLKKFSGTVGDVAKTFASIGIVAGGVAAAGIIKAAKAAGDLAEAAAKFDTVFGDRANVVREWAFETGKALGVARREMLDTLSGFQDLFVPIGISAERAKEMSIQMTQLGIDLASFNNRANADVVRDLQAAMTGSSETMKKYGVVVDAAAVEQELLNRGITGTITNAQKLEARLAIIMRATTAAQGDAKRTMESFNNVMKSLKATIEDSLAAIGEQFDPGFAQLGRIGVKAVEDITSSVDDLGVELSDANQAVLDLAEAGMWEDAGELIGLQIRKGLRKTLLPAFVDTVLEAAERLERIGIPTTLSSTLSRSTQNIRRAAEGMAQPGMGAGPNRIGDFIMGTAANTEEDRRISELVNIARQTLQETRRNREANEDQEGAVFQ